MPAPPARTNGRVSGGEHALEHPLRASTVQADHPGRASGECEIALVWAGAAGQFDGIDGYTRELAHALDAVRGIRCRVTTPADARGADILLLQYNPFSWGRRGFAPRLLVWMARRRSEPGRPTLVTMIHEPFVAPEDLRTTAMAGWQRAQLTLVKALSDRVLAPSADAARRARGRGQRIPVVPVGSNLPDRRLERAAARERLGLGHRDVVLVTFERSGVGRLHTHVAAAVEAAREVAPVQLLVLGAGAHAVPDVHPSVGVQVAGPLPDDEVALRLAAGDVFLANYVDGLSTRRTSLVAALQHGLPVVGTTAGRTDEHLLGCDGIVAVPADDVQGYAFAVRLLAASHEERSRRGVAALRLYDERFDWAVVARRVLQVIGREA